MVETYRKIQAFLAEPLKPHTKEEAARILRSCGILDENNEIMPAFKDILYKKESAEEDND